MNRVRIDSDIAIWSREQVNHCNRGEIWRKTRVIIEQIESIGAGDFIVEYYFVPLTEDAERSEDERTD